jgi:hypothetical protein
VAGDPARRRSAAVRTADDAAAVIGPGVVTCVVRILAALIIDVEPDYRSNLERWPMRA